MVEKTHILRFGEVVAGVYLEKHLFKKGLFVTERKLLELVADAWQKFILNDLLHLNGRLDWQQMLAFTI